MQVVLVKIYSFYVFLKKYFKGFIYIFVFIFFSPTDTIGVLKKLIAFQTGKLYTRFIFILNKKNQFF